MKHWTSITFVGMLTFLLLPLAPTSAAGGERSVGSGGELGDVLNPSDPDFSRLVKQYIDGENLVLGIVDGTPITVENIKSQHGATLDTMVNTCMKLQEDPAYPYARATQEQAEFALVIQLARQEAESTILLREALRADLNIPDVQVDAYIKGIKQSSNINPDDPAAWAEFTLQQYNKTPLKFREGLRDSLLRLQVMALMSGEYGPVRQLALPVFFPLEVSPAEIREEYEATKDQWRAYRNIEYTLVGIEYPRTTTRSTRERVQMMLIAARARMSNKESLEDIGRFLASELDALPEKTAIRLVGPKDERAASDADLELAIDKIRKMNVGEITEVLITKSPSSGIAAELAYFVRLNRREELLKRAFADPVVQSQLRDGLLARKSENNKARVTAALIDRAIVVPRSMLAQ